MADRSTPDIQYRSDLHSLIVRWLHPVTDTQMRADYEAVLEAALEYGQCRHWLFDIRRRELGGEEVNTWARNEFFARLPQQLDGPVRVAFLATPRHLARIVLGSTQAVVNAAAETGSRLRFFADEAAALHWLAG